MSHLSVMYRKPIPALRFDSVKAHFASLSEHASAMTKENWDQLHDALLIHRAEVYGVERLDADETALVELALEARSGHLQETKRAALKARLLIPMEDTIAPGADSYSSEIWDDAGMAELVGSYTDDIAMVGLNAKKYTVTLADYALGYQLSIKDLEAAAFTGTPLPTRKAKAVIKGFEARLEITAAFGDSAAGFTGFFNHANLPVISAAAPGTGSDATWDGGDKTAEEVVDDMTTMVNTVQANTQYVEEVDTVLVPPDLFLFIQKTLVGVGTRSNPPTILDEFRRLNPGISVAGWHQCSTGGASSTPCAIAYRRDIEALKMEVKEPSPLPAFQRNAMVSEHVSRGRYGAVEWRLPLSAVRMDGV